MVDWKCALQQAAAAELAKVFSVYCSNLAVGEPSATDRFHRGLANLKAAYDRAESMLEGGGLDARGEG